MFEYVQQSSIALRNVGLGHDVHGHSRVRGPTDLGPRLDHEVDDDRQFQGGPPVLSRGRTLLVQRVIERFRVRDLTLLLPARQLTLLREHHDKWRNAAPPVEDLDVVEDQVPVEYL